MYLFRYVGVYFFVMVSILEVGRSFDGYDGVEDTY